MTSDEFVDSDGFVAADGSVQAGINGVVVGGSNGTEDGLVTGGSDEVSGNGVGCVGAGEVVDAIPSGHAVVPVPRVDIIIG